MSVNTEGFIVGMSGILLVVQGLMMALAAIITLIGSFWGENRLQVVGNLQAGVFFGLIGAACLRLGFWGMALAFQIAHGG